MGCTIRIVVSAPLLVAALLGAAMTVGVPQTGPPPVVPALTPRLQLAVAVPYRAPVTPLRVVRGFVPPPTPYAAGHRGVDLVVRSGQSVYAAGAGSVAFAGDVAGRGVVVLLHADGIRTEYEPIRPSVRTGAVVLGGAPIGTVAGDHGSCPPSSCLHWGARRGEIYLDPLSLLTPLGPVRLLPWVRRAGGPAGRPP